MMYDGLSGTECKQVILRRLEAELDKSPYFKEHIAYHRFSLDVGIAFQGYPPNEESFAEEYRIADFAADRATGQALPQAARPLSFEAGFGEQVEIPLAGEYDDAGNPVYGGTSADALRHELAQQSAETEELDVRPGGVHAHLMAEKSAAEQEAEQRARMQAALRARADAVPEPVADRSLSERMKLHALQQREAALNKPKAEVIEPAAPQAEFAPLVADSEPGPLAEAPGQSAAMPLPKIRAKQSKAAPNPPVGLGAITGGERGGLGG